MGKVLTAFENVATTFKVGQKNICWYTEFQEFDVFACFFFV